MLVKSNLSHVLTVSGLFIFPGINEFTKEESAIISKSQYFKDFQKDDSLQIIEVDLEEKIDSDEEGVNPIVATILSASAEDAIELINEFFLIDDLRILQEKESERKPKRKKVIDAIARQLAKLTADRKKEEDEV